MQLRVAIDGNESNVANRVGSNVYAYQLLHHLELITRGLNSRITVLLAAPPLPDLPKARDGWQYQVITPTTLWTQWALPLYLYQHKNQFDLFYTPGHYAPRLCPLPYISSVMDLAFLEFPNQFKRKDFLQLKHWTEYSVKKAAHVVAISQFTKNDICQRYGLNQEQVSVIYPAVDQFTPLNPAKVFSTLKKYKLRTPFILYVGTIQPRKNIERLVEAYAIYRRQLAATRLDKATRKRIPTDRVQLVIAGKIGWLAEPLLQKIAQSSFKNDIILTGFVDEEAKQALIQSALGLTLLGTYEGFGIPALEALHLKTIPVVSSHSSLPEVVGSAGIQVDPYSVPAIAQALLQLTLLSSKVRAMYLRQARMQLTHFNWHTSAQQLYDLFFTVYQQNRKN